VAITAVQQATQPSEWEEARVVLVCRPSVETLFGVLNTDAANFLRRFDLDQARVEHDGFRQAMEERGVRVFDLRDPYRVEELAYFVPKTPPGSHLPSTQVNDVFVDERGLIYAVERIAGGLYILEYTGPVPLS